MREECAVGVAAGIGYRTTISMVRPGMKFGGNVYKPYSLGSKNMLGEPYAFMKEIAIGFKLERKTVCGIPTTWVIAVPVAVHLVKQLTDKVFINNGTVSKFYV